MNHNRKHVIIYIFVLHTALYSPSKNLNQFLWAVVAYRNAVIGHDL